MYHVGGEAAPCPAVHWLLKKKNRKELTMDLLLIILGYIFLALIIIAIIVFFALRSFWGKIKSMGSLFEPIELEVDPRPKWINKPEVQTLIRDFEALGFKPLRVYKETNMKIRPMILANDARDQFGELYQTPQEIVTGFCAETTDSMNLNVTTTRLADTFALKPNKITESYPEDSISELYEKFTALIANQQLKVIEDEHFDEYLQEQMNKEIQSKYEHHELPLWQDGEEIFVERWRKHYQNETELHQAYEMLSSEAMQQIESEIAENLGQAEDLSAATHSRYGYNFTIFSPRLHKAGFCEYLIDAFSCWDGIRSSRIKELAEESTDTAELFERFRAEYPQLKLNTFYSVTTPIEADLWGYEDLDEGEEGGD
jgi:hypothetical protein